MGTRGYSEVQVRATVETFRSRQIKAEQADQERRARFAAKIVMAVVDKVVNDIVRPGPVPEERECYEMAAEMRALVPELESLVIAIIAVEEST